MAEQIMALTGGRPVDSVLVARGGAASDQISMALQLVKFGGHVACVSGYFDDEAVTIPLAVWNGGISEKWFTGSLAGAGRDYYERLLSLIDDGHELVVHARNGDRLTALRDLERAGATVVVGDLSDLEQTRSIARDVNALGRIDAVIHNAGVYTGLPVMPVNIVALYLLTVLIDRPQRLIDLSSGAHRSGHTNLNGMDWSGLATGSYSDSKLFVSTLAVAVARLWPDVFVNAVDPGWVPTRMGGPAAPDDLRLGHLTQEWLATSEEPNARTSGGYWYHSDAASPIPPSTTGDSRTTYSTSWVTSRTRALAEDSMSDAAQETDQAKRRLPLFTLATR